ncbi:MAG: DMP19 family protein [Gemmataceae bacterium]|nr:DMP19 family protein [Gemmataceae bacterium]
METRLPATELEAVRSCFYRKQLIDSFYALAEKLLWRNEAAAKCLDAAIARGIIVPEDELNGSQLTLETIALLSLEVPNGGLLQFFWNRPAWIERVPESLRSVGLPALADAFERSTAELISRVGPYSEFRKRDSLQAYSECASEFSFDEFDSAYYDHEEQVYAKTIEFVSQRLGDFVA